MAEGELVKLPTAGEAAGGENGGDAARRRTVWRTRAWVGDGEGEREATWELIGQGMAAAQSLGAKVRRWFLFFSVREGQKGFGFCFV